MKQNYSKNQTEMFNKVFKVQFGYYPIRDKEGNLLKEEDVTYENLGKLQLMGYIPFVIECLNKLKKPNFRDVVKLKGTALPTSCGTLGCIYRKIGFTKYEGKTMCKGDNYTKFLTTKWDWFKVNGSDVFVKGETYPLYKMKWVDYRNRYQNDWKSIVPTETKKELKELTNKISKLQNKIDNMKVVF